jgi:hypothetical protein
MKITRRQLQEIITEEVSVSSEDRYILEEAVGKEVFAKVGIEIGKALLAAMMKTKNGRNTLANILTALPDFIKEKICSKPELLTKSMESKFVVGAARAVGMVCRFSTTLSFGLLYAVAYLLRSMDDETAAAVMDEAGVGDSQSPGEEVPSGDSDLDGVPDEVDIDDLEDDRMVAESIKEDKMKITRRQLQEIISSALYEADVTLSPEEIKAAKDELDKEGGAAGDAPVASAMRSADKDDVDISDEDYIDSLVKDDPAVKRLRQGDIVHDTEGQVGQVSESKKK